jgi:hypothetical protein
LPISLFGALLRDLKLAFMDPLIVAPKLPGIAVSSPPEQLCRGFNADVTTFTKAEFD